MRISVTGEPDQAYLPQLSADCSGRSYDRQRSTAFHQTAALWKNALRLYFPSLHFQYENIIHDSPDFVKWVLGIFLQEKNKCGIWKAESGLVVSPYGD